LIVPRETSENAFEGDALTMKQGKTLMIGTELLHPLLEEMLDNQHRSSRRNIEEVGPDVANRSVELNLRRVLCWLVGFPQLGFHLCVTLDDIPKLAFANGIQIHVEAHAWYSTELSR
jgi:hypothetical protein